MGEVLNKLFDLLPFVRDGSSLLKWTFLAWVLVSALLILAGAYEYLHQPSKTAAFQVDLQPNAYLDERELLLRGSGLPEGATLQAKAFLVDSSGDRQEVTQAPVNVVREPDGKWQVRWLRFRVPGKHEIIVEATKDGKMVAAPLPIRIIVGQWVPSPTSNIAGVERGDLISGASSSQVSLDGSIRIRDVGKEGSVAGLAVAAAMEARVAGAGRPLPFLSGRYLYERSRRSYRCLDQPNYPSSRAVA